MVRLHSRLLYWGAVCLWPLSQMKLSNIIWRYIIPCMGHCLMQNWLEIAYSELFWLTSVIYHSTKSCVIILIFVFDTELNGRKKHMGSMNSSCIYFLKSYNFTTFLILLVFLCTKFWWDGFIRRSYSTNNLQEAWPYYI